MTAQSIPANYSRSFEAGRRISPRIWDADYCLLKGLAAEVKAAAAKYAPAGTTVVDLGCGGKPYFPFFAAASKYIGVDACQSDVADLVVPPGQAVPLPDGAADFILSTQVVYLVPDFFEYLRECRRLLKPSGRMLITTHGTWTYHPASGGDYYRFTQDGLKHILSRSGFELESITPIVGTLGTGLHLRQLVFNYWLSRLPFGSAVAAILNVFTNCRILLEDAMTPKGTRMSSPVIFAAIARCRQV